MYSQQWVTTIAEAASARSPSMPASRGPVDGSATSRCGAGADRAPTTLYWIVSYSLNIGMYIAMTTKPTIRPTKTIMIGSRIEVSALTAASTSSS